MPNRPLSYVVVFYHVAYVGTLPWAIYLRRAEKASKWQLAKAMLFESRHHLKLKAMYKFGLYPNVFGEAKAPPFFRRQAVFI